MSATKTRPVEAIRQLHEFSVSGLRPFPIDMLRYDSCWPATEARDSYELAATFGRGGNLNALFTINLVGLRAPTVGRWESFGWKVLS